ncbi:MAG TPA: DNA repair protein RecN [Bacteroidales bacterium]|jgi:DNA repair protein RecN (Recombination protein N)|nr:DNA repair protein RecN [Bacteroidales bacterium]HQH23906.1 DNA repair protein RecN [Bacteroidales bacterium]HQJ81236.1 DNA repair protein RecN [Bacteroidales bacterium]
MLVRLSVRNYALIRDLDIDFGNGLTIITGETGAGKTILLGALSLILGARADTSVLLDKENKCIVEGTFSVEGHEMKSFFEENDLDYDSHAILRREISSAGKSRAFINDTPVNITILKELGESLIDIHSQHQTLMLNNNSFQLNVVDSFAGTAAVLDEYRERYIKYRNLRRAYAGESAKAEKNRADLEYYRFQLNQLDSARLTEGEQEELEREQELLSHAEEIVTGLAAITECFSAESGSILSSLSELRNILNRIKGFLPGGEELAARTESSYIELNDLSSEIEGLSASISADPARLAQVNERLDTIYTLARKHQVNGLDELLVKREEIRKLVQSIETGDERLAEMESLIRSEEAVLTKMASSITGKRKKSLPETEKNITGMLRQLGMPNARFRIDFSSQADFSESGRDQVDFLFSANKQIDPENLAKTASGGELSRVMLSLKSFLTRNVSLPTIIFDEIDSGVSGEVADKVGQILSSMGKYMQVINITHLPQVASRGARHFHVYKEDEGDSTITRVKLLSGDERIMEVARLLSGSEVTQAALKNARELLEAAGN